MAVRGNELNQREQERKNLPIRDRRRHILPYHHDGKGLNCPAEHEFLNVHTSVWDPRDGNSSHLNYYRPVHFNKRHGNKR